MRFLKFGKSHQDTEIVRKHQEVTAEIIQKLRSMQVVLDKMGNGQEKRKVAAENIGKLLVSLLPLLLPLFISENLSLN